MWGLVSVKKGARERVSFVHDERVGSGGDAAHLAMIPNHERMNLKTGRRNER